MSGKLNKTIMLLVLHFFYVFLFIYLRKRSRSSNFLTMFMFSVPELDLISASSPKVREERERERACGKKRSIYRREQGGELRVIFIFLGTSLYLCFPKFQVGSCEFLFGSWETCSFAQILS